MRFLKLLFPVLLFSLSSSAQGYLPGYVVPNNGDTLKGYIKYVRTENSPRVIRFKADANAKVNKYPVANVRYFSIDIGYPLDFQRYSGPISMDDIKIDNITTLRDTSFRIDTVFLKILRKGKNITLYSYGDALKTRFFVAGLSAVSIGFVIPTCPQTPILRGSPAPIRIGTGNAIELVMRVRGTDG